MGRKAKKMSEAQARVALKAVKNAFKEFNSIYSLIDDSHPKSSQIPQKYSNVWYYLRRFKDLMELEVERAG